MEIDLTKILKDVKKSKTVVSLDDVPFQICFTKNRVASMRCEGQSIFTDAWGCRKIAIAGFSNGGFGTDYLQIDTEKQTFQEPFYFSSPREGIEKRLSNLMLQEQTFFQNGIRLLLQNKKHFVYFYPLKAKYNNIKGIILPQNRTLHIVAITIM